MTENCMEERGGDPGMYREPDDVLNRIAVLSRTFLWQVDTSGIYTFVSDAVESILGYRPEELVGAVRFYDLHPDGGRDEFRETAFGAFSRKEPFRSVQRAIADAMAISATLAGVVKVVRRELGELMDARNFLIAEYDDSTKMLFAQPSLSSDEKELVTRWSGEKSLTGMVIRNRHAMRFSKEEIRWLADQGAIDLVGARAEAWLGVPLQNRESVFGAIIVQSYDDPAAYDDGSMEVLQVVADQLSVYIEKKRMEDRLRESEARYSAIVENSPLGIMLQDADGIVVYANPALAGMLGVSPEAIEGRPYLDFVHPDDREESRRRIDGNLADGLRIPLREHRYFHPDGREITV